jgi:hypothetical protein
VIALAVEGVLGVLELENLARLVLRERPKHAWGFLRERLSR